MAADRREEKRETSEESLHQTEGNQVLRPLAAPGLIRKNSGLKKTTPPTDASALRRRTRGR